MVIMMTCRKLIATSSQTGLVIALSLVVFAIWRQVVSSWGYDEPMLFVLQPPRWAGPLAHLLWGLIALYWAGLLILCRRLSLDLERYSLAPLLAGLPFIALEVWRIGRMMNWGPWPIHMMDSTLILEASSTVWTAIICLTPIVAVFSHPSKDGIVR